MKKPSARSKHLGIRNAHPASAGNSANASRQASPFAEKMKKGIIAVVLVTISLFVWAGSGEGDPDYGKSPAFILAGSVSGILWWFTALAVALIRKDRILLWAIGLSLLGFVLLLFSALAFGTNAFGAFWGASIGIAAFGCLTILMLFTRLAYLTLKSEPVATGQRR